VNFPLDILFKRFTTCVIICLCDKWLPQHKKNFPCLSAKKIENIHRIINDSRKNKPKINITTKGSLRKQIIIPINNNNKTKLIASLSIHITNINIVLKNIKNNIMTDFVRID